ncbi:MAG TPA: zf-HC2 domain-containing protein [Ktedonobacteraceae bacterium]|jgi:mycothiol system anti-sigma-R factor|nr:zf-HC2 domain-containing protein [Ktedonobacteraceae bacterium]
MDCLNCVEATARLHLYIDRELTAEEVEVVQQHLADCPSCECRFHFDMRIKRLIHERCTIAHAPEHLREAVMRIARAPVGERLDLDPALVMEIKADLEG